MLVLEDGHGGVDVVVPTWNDRMSAMARADHLDHELTEGASPDATAQLSLRADRLTRMSNRLSLARAARQLAAGAARPTRLGSPRLLARSAVSAAARELQTLADRLEQPGPVSAAGMARVSVLLSAAWGPQYRNVDVDDLRSDVRDAIYALNPFHEASPFHNPC